MAELYDYETGNKITVGLQGCNVCDEALQMAQRIASERDSDAGSHSAFFQVCQ